MVAGQVVSPLPPAAACPGLRLGGFSSVDFPAIAFFRRSRERTVRCRTQRAHPYAVLILGMLPALAAAACDWSRPGAAPFRAAGDVTAAVAVESYTDIPAAARADLATRIRGQREDAVLFIGPSTLHSPQGTATHLRDMHWRNGLCRGDVSRAGWAPGHTEAALVYCSEGHCVAVPTRCGNVARVTFEPHAARAEQLQQWGGDVQPVHGVPEPGTAALALLAAALWRLQRCAFNQRQEARDAA